MAATPEGKVKDAIKKVLKKHGAWYFMPVSNGMGQVGIPDFICCWNGKFVGVEAKAPGKTANVTDNQLRVIGAIKKAGGLAWVIDDAQQLDSLLATIHKLEESHHDDFK